MLAKIVWMAVSLSTCLMNPVDAKHVVLQSEVRTALLRQVRSRSSLGFVLVVPGCQMSNEIMSKGSSTNMVLSICCALWLELFPMM